MSVVFSGTNQGVFTSDGTAKTLWIRSDVDYIRVYNQTKIAASATSTGLEFYWQRNMAAGTGIEYQSNAGGTAVNTVWMTSGGFTLADNTLNEFGASVALTQVDGSTPPVVSTGATSTIVNGDTVRLYSVLGGLQLNGIDFTIGEISANTSFELSYMPPIVTTGATTGTWRRVPYDPYFYPPTRTISKVLKSTLNGSNVAIITMTVTHNYTVGQKVRFKVPQVTATKFGMTELNDVEATIVAINAADTNGITNTITVDVDASGFTAFAWPLTANGAFTPAQVIPVGENTAQANTSAVNPYGDAQVNNGMIGIRLAAGTDSPAGATSDVIYWVAGKSFNA